MVLLSVLIVIIQATDLYLRYLAFSSEISETESRHLLYTVCILSVVLVHIYFGVFYFFGITVVTYKLILLFGWLPYAFLFVKVIKRPLTQHFFAIGMNLIWGMLQHNWAAIIDTSLFADLLIKDFAVVHSILYLMLFTATFPIEMRIFTKVLPETKLLESRPLGLYIAALPFVVSFGHLFLWADNQMIHSWAERVSRIYMLIAFFLIYQYVSVGAKIFYDYQKTFRNVRRVEEQVASLNYHTTLMQESAQRMDKLRQNLHNDYLKMYEMISNNEIELVQKYIQQKNEMLNSTKLITFSRAPLINASISIYAEQAKKNDIDFFHEVNISDLKSTEENDLAILISNLLENAITASKQQPHDRRNISLKLTNDGKNFSLEISNLYDYPFVTGADGLPQNSKKEYGIGMTSLEAFIKNYKANVKFFKADERVQILVCWED